VKGPHVTFGTCPVPHAVVQPVFAAADAVPYGMCYQQQCACKDSASLGVAVELPCKNTAQGYGLSRVLSSD
jgi:hypothetical protein